MLSELGPGFLGLEKHGFPHLECPLEDDSGVLLLGRQQDKAQAFMEPP